MGSSLEQNSSQQSMESFSSPLPAEFNLGPVVESEVSGLADVDLDGSGGNVRTPISSTSCDIEEFWNQFYDDHCDGVDAGVDAINPSFNFGELLLL